MKFEFTSERVAQAKKSLTIKMHAALAGLGLEVAHLADTIATACNDFLQYLPSVQSYLDPKVVSAVGSVIALVSFLTIFIRAFHNSSPKTRYDDPKPDADKPVDGPNG